MRLFRRKEAIRAPVAEKRVLILLDWENLEINLLRVPPCQYTVEKWLIRLKDQIVADFGEIVDIYVFGSEMFLHRWKEPFTRLGFVLMPTPPSIKKNGTEPEPNLTDHYMIKRGGKLLDLKGLTHLVIGSGDQHFLPLINEAKNRGLGVIVVVGSKDSLSAEIRRRADKIYYLPL